MNNDHGESEICSKPEKGVIIGISLNKRRYVF